MRTLALLLLAATTSLGAETSTGAVNIDLSSFHASQQFAVHASGDLLSIAWNGENQSSLRLILNPANAEQLISELSQWSSVEGRRKVLLKWARFAVWDTAADGAITEPVRFDDAP